MKHEIRGRLRGSVTRRKKEERKRRNKSID